MITTSDPPPRIILDTGPLVALFHAEDAHHLTAARGFAQLGTASTHKLAPLPVVFEVFKWLTHNAGPRPARRGLDEMRRRLVMLYSDQEDMDELTALIRQMPNWAGSMEDALVALVGLKLDVPVWTFNYRDLAAFRNLRFWNPA